MIKIGILGAAQAAPSAIIEPVSLRDDCEISVVACRDRARGESFAEQHNIPDVETDYRKMVNRNDVDLVYNALPPSRHADLSIAALESGKAVLCEKPFAMNAMEARQMVAAAKETGLPLIEAFHYRFHPAFKRILEILQSGELGKVVRMEAVFVAPVPFREGEVRHTLSIGGGSLMDMGCYPVHWSRMVMGSEPKVIKSDCFTDQPNIDVTTKADLAFKNGATAVIECSMDTNRPFQSELKIWCKKGRLHFDNPLLPHSGHLITIERDGVIKTEVLDGRKTYDYQLEHMLGIMKGGVELITGGNDAISNMEVIDNIYKHAGLPVR